MKYIGSYKNPADIATKQNVDDVTPFIVNVTNNNGALTADKTFDEVSAAISAKRTVMALFEQYVLYTANYQPNSLVAFCGAVDDGSIVESLIYGADGALLNYVFYIPNLIEISNGKIVKRDSDSGAFVDAVPGTDYMAPVPVTADDNGKFLRVVNGAWAAATVPDANGVSF